MLAALPVEYGTVCAAGWKPKIQRPSSLIVWRGPTATRRPSRSTDSVTVPPRLDRIKCDAASNEPVGRPLTATIRSPGWRPAAAAGVPLSTAKTSALARCEGPPLSAKTKNRIRNATTMFASGPAAMTATRFHVAPRQYASGEVPSSTSRSARSVERLARGVSSCGTHLLLELGAGPPRRLVVLHLESASKRADGRHEARLLTHCRLDEQTQIARRRPVHAGQLDEAAERDHADPVLDALALDLDEGRREADVEAPRPHPDRARHPEVPQLVQEDEQDETGDHDQIRHAVASAPSAISRAARSASTRSSTSRTGSVPAAASVSPTTSGIPRNGRRPARNAATATSFAAL